MAEPEAVTRAREATRWLRDGVRNNFDNCECQAMGPDSVSLDQDWLLARANEFCALLVKYDEQTLELDALAASIPDREAAAWDAGWIARAKHGRGFDYPRDNPPPPPRTLNPHKTGEPDD